ncbi:DUF397 domain-containing protein [Streptomyces sp. NPDC047973]|uniref:DUF397 domain-containing protein n=1 Tax=Streptomyces sp. NPDC047973 TaxID=3155383 RepID=UPI0034410E73
MSTTPPTAAELAGASWRTSTYSAANNECVEVATGLGPWVGVRDSKVEQGPALAVPADAFASLIGAVRSGSL